MAAISGCTGKVMVGASDVAKITTWSLELSANIDKFGHSGSGCYKDGVAGTKDSSGSFDFKLDVADTVYGVLDVGQSVTLKLYENATRFWTVYALIETISLEVDIDEGNAVSGSVNFQGIVSGSPAVGWVEPT